VYTNQSTILKIPCLNENTARRLKPEIADLGGVSRRAWFVTDSKEIRAI
jgi:hypothetical protein